MAKDDGCSALGEMGPVFGGPAQPWLHETQLPCEFPYVWGFASDPTLGSAVEPVPGSGSEEDDSHAADLAERIARAMLDDEDADEDEDSMGLKASTKHWAAEDITPWPAPDARKGLYSQFSGSEIWSGSETWSTSSRSSTCSSEGSPQNSSPPSTPLSPENDPWDLLYPAAVEVMKMKASEDLSASDASYAQGFKQDQGLRVPKHGQQTAWGDTDPGMLPSSHPLLSGWGIETHQTKINRFPTLPSLYGDMTTSATHILQHSSSAGTKDSNPKIAGAQSKLPKQVSASPWGRKNRPPLIQQQSVGHAKGNKGGCGQRASWSIDASPTTQWPPLQPAGGSGLRAVFLGSNASGRESAGTGVFLPRPIGAAAVTKRKPACSTVLLPSRVVQALNLNTDDVHPPVPRSAAAYKASNYSRKEASAPCTFGQQAARSNFSSLWKPFYSGCSPLQQACPEIALPTEWTY